MRGRGERSLAREGLNGVEVITRDGREGGM